MAANNISDITKKKPEKKRLKLSWILSLILLALVVVAFGLSPLAGAFGNNSSELIFGYYNGEPIEFSYNSYFYKQREQIASNWDTEASSTSYEYQIYQIWKQAYDNTVMHTALMQEAASSNMVITPDAVDRYLLKSGPYIRDGKFDEELYNSVSEITKSNIRNEVEDSLLIQNIQSDLFGSYSAPGELEFIASMGTSEKAFDYVVLPLSLYPDDLAAAYGTSNSNQFTAIEVSVITFSSGSRQDAEAVHERLRNNELTFEEAARTYSIDTFAEDGGLIGKVMFHEVRENFTTEEDVNRIFSLENGEISDVLETPYGYNIYRANSNPILPDFSDPEILSSVKEYLIINERGEVEDYIISMAETLLSNSSESAADTLGTIARENDLTVYSTASTPVNFGGTLFLKSFANTDEEGYIANLENEETSLVTLYQTPAESFSEPILIDSGVLLSVCTEDVNAEPQTEILELYYPYLVPQIQQNDYTNAVFTSDRFEDNFMSTFLNSVLASD